MKIVFAIFCLLILGNKSGHAKSQSNKVCGYRDNSCNKDWPKTKALMKDLYRVGLCETNSNLSTCDTVNGFGKLSRGQYLGGSAGSLLMAGMVSGNIPDKMLTNFVFEIDQQLLGLIEELQDDIKNPARLGKSDIAYQTKIRKEMIKSLQLVKGSLDRTEGLVDLDKFNRAWDALKKSSRVGGVGELKAALGFKTHAWEFIDDLDHFAKNTGEYFRKSRFSTGASKSAARFIFEKSVKRGIRWFSTAVAATVGPQVLASPYIIGASTVFEVAGMAHDIRSVTCICTQDLIDLVGSDTAAIDPCEPKSGRIDENILKNLLSITDEEAQKQFKTVRGLCNYVKNLHVRMMKPQITAVSCEKSTQDHRTIKGIGPDGVALEAQFSNGKLSAFKNLSDNRNTKKDHSATFKADGTIEYLCIHKGKARGKTSGDFRGKCPFKSVQTFKDTDGKIKYSKTKTRASNAISSKHTQYSHGLQSLRLSLKESFQCSCAAPENMISPERCQKITKRTSHKSDSVKDTKATK